MIQDRVQAGLRPEAGPEGDETDEAVEDTEDCVHEAVPADVRMERSYDALCPEEIYDEY